jgi:hypothetical protein
MGWMRMAGPSLSLRRSNDDVLSAEEDYWRQRGRQEWLLKGGANTKLFHAFANGRKRKCAILSLEDETGQVTDPRGI